MFQKKVRTDDEVRVHAVLIDLDRVKPVDGSPFCPCGSVMYKRKPGWSNRQLDWKQFGLMLDFILDDSIVDYHDLYYQVAFILSGGSKDKFISNLIASHHYYFYSLGDHLFHFCR